MTDNCGTSVKYGITISVCSLHWRYRIAALSRDWKRRAASTARVTGGMLSRGGIVDVFRGGQGKKSGRESRELA
jgi:hypothetical protein